MDEAPDGTSRGPRSTAGGDSRDARGAPEGRRIRELGSGEERAGSGEHGSSGGDGNAGVATPAEGATDSSTDTVVFYCDLCGNVMLNLHCKLICERCGYKRDCSDP